MENAIKVGQVIEFDYPAANYRNARRRMERRIALVSEIRNLAKQPLAPVTLQADPDLCRGVNLVTAFDLEKQANRKFYLESMENIALAAPSGSSDGADWSVMWIECDPEWSPAEGRDLPDEFVIKDWLAKGIAAPIAEIIVAGANSLAMKNGNRGRWAWICPPGFLNQFEISP